MSNYYGYMNGDNPLFSWIEDLRDDWISGVELPLDTASPFGRHSISVEVDKDGDEYLDVAFVLPDDVYAEIDHDTYGQLHGFRIYRDV